MIEILMSGVFLLGEGSEGEESLRVREEGGRIGSVKGEEFRVCVGGSGMVEYEK
ncbi:hypothetical protein [Bacillus subtilis]|uniref:hypothetical protein n=1 Tax=Bacillus subtilis TaxID=1423 RepID=UPI00164345FE|nr:hypothetical protein [Bacillus subtilis]